MPNVNDFKATQEDVDYSDFEYQQGLYTLNVRMDGNSSVSGHATIDPLAGRGGLDNNEVAELVHIDILAYTEMEDEVADQNVGTTGSFRGILGVNLPAVQDVVPAFQNETAGTSFSEDGGVTVNSIRSNTGTDDRIFDQFQASFGIPFDDETNGVGGGGSHEHYQREIAFRNLVGRGPVVDSNDDIAIIGDVNTSDSIIDISAEVRLEMIWDTAEVDDAGRAFSVPSMM